MTRASSSLFHSLCLRRSDRRRQCNSTPFPGMSRFDHQPLTPHFLDPPRGPISRYLRHALLHLPQGETHIFRLVGMCPVYRTACFLLAERTMLTLLLPKARLGYHRSQWSYGRIRRSDTRVSKNVPSGGFCGVGKRHDCSLDHPSGLRCP